MARPSLVPGCGLATPLNRGVEASNRDQRPVCRAVPDLFSGRSPRYMLGMVLVLDKTPGAPAGQPHDVSAARRTLAGLGRDPLRQCLVEVGIPEKQLRMRVEQLWSWLYVRGVTTFDAMTDVSKDIRGRLAAAYSLDRPEIVSEQVSVDGTRKWLL
ncbi:MAG TPA: hypothetical protein VFV47_13220, partial [Hyphomicrobiaceae bacterium]|nr:hypothetical protein [Hyphomicrobiaceae bacterium]